MREACKSGYRGAGKESSGFRMVLRWQEGFKKREMVVAQEPGGGRGLELIGLLGAGGGWGKGWWGTGKPRGFEVRRGSL